MEDFLIHHYPMAPVHHKGQILTDQQQYYYQIIKQKNFDYEDHAARLLNIKLSPSCVEGENGTEKLVQFYQSMATI